MILTGSEVDQYLPLACALLEEARLNQFFPSAPALRNLLRAMHSDCHRGLYPQLVLNPETGLPAEKEVSRVQADYALAQRPRDEEGPEIRGRLAQRLAYYHALLEAPPPPSVFLDLRLRKVEPATQTAFFVVTFDRFDLAQSVFVRYTIVLSQTASCWCRPQVELRGDDLESTATFRNAVARFTSDEAEFAFLLLSDLPGIVVEDVYRCRVGPLYRPGVKMPADFEALLSRHPGGLLLHLPGDRAARSLPRDGCTDPLAVLYRSFLTPEARQPVEERARQLAYRVWKERKFVCTPDLFDDLKALLAARRTHCVIRALPRPAPTRIDRTKEMPHA